MTVGVGCAAASLLGLARLVPQHRWLLALTLGLLALGAGLVAILLWLGDDPSEWYLRGLGGPDRAGGVRRLRPVLHWVDRSELKGVEFLTDSIR